MGTAKHLLPFSDGEPIYRHLLTRIIDAHPTIEALYISLRDPAPASELCRFTVEDRTLGIIYDDIQDPSLGGTADIGPAAGLLAAFRTDPTCTWLVLACDYPLMTSKELQVLIKNYDGSLTCFKNAENWAEPLLGLWSPRALQHLRFNVAKGITGPKGVIKDLKSKTCTPEDSRSLFNTNTVHEWEAALKLGREMNLCS